MKLKQKKVLQVAQEITFARALASNEKSLRERALRRLKKWLLARSNESESFSEEGFMRLWKGLFYCIWMSDKPLVQEENVNDVSCLVHCFNNFEDFSIFTQCFYQAMSQAWFGLDQFRLDKFMMLVRRFLRESFQVLAKRGWKPSDIERFSQDMYNSIRMAPIGMSLHLTEIYLEELAKVGRESLENKLIIFFLTPFGKLMAESSDPRILSHISSHIFIYLIRQSDEGIKEQIKFNTWRDQGFPGGSIDMMEEMPNPNTVDEEKSETDIEDTEEPMDPRAGHVNVSLPSISFDPADVINLLTSLRYGKDTTTKAKKSIASLIEKFKKVQSGEFPLGLKKVEIPDDEDEEEIITEAVESLVNWEKSEFELDNKNKLKMIDYDENKCKGSRVWEVTPFENNLELSSKISPAPSFGKWDVTPMKETSKKCMKRKFSDGNKKNDNKNSVFINNTKCTLEKPINPIDNVQLKRSSDDLVDNNKPETRKRKKRNKKQKTKQSNNHVPKTNSFQANLNKHSELPKLTTPNSVKRVAFSLSKNMSHEENEYKKTIKKHTSLPYDAERKPIQGVLKSSPIGSPINPFYKS